MPVEDWALVACVVIAGLWSGLLAMLTTILHPILRGMDGAGFTRFLDAFLPVARKSAFNYAMVIGLVAAPTTALIALGSDGVGEPVFILTAVGLALAIAGPLIVSNRLAAPNYDTILAWDPDHLPADWEQTKQRYFALNWIRAVATWAALALFVAALVDRLQ
jgi:hypothetical protein